MICLYTRYGWLGRNDATSPPAGGSTMAVGLYWSG